ncbi:hypothetical protein ACNKHW_01190 [Shigella flexneri]
MVPLVNAKRRAEFEAIKAEVAPELAVHLLDGRARDAMIAPMPHCWHQVRQRWSACWRNARWWWATV